LPDWLPELVMALARAGRLYGILQARSARGPEDRANKEPGP
jgi:hypothetical protein